MLFCRSLRLFSDIPDISLEYSQILLNLEIQQQIYQYLYPQYESAKINELKDLPTIEIIDKAVPAGMRSKPQRAKMCVLLFLVGLSFSSSIAIIFELLSEEQKNKFSSFNKILFGRKNQ